MKASNTRHSAQFGRSLTLSGDGSTFAVGAIGEDSNSRGINGDQNGASARNGAVYVFVRTGTAWSQQAYVKASNSSMGSLFGWSVSLSADGSTLLVAADAESSSATDIGGDEESFSTERAGAAYLFRRVGITWSQEAFVKAHLHWRRIEHFLWIQKIVRVCCLLQGTHGLSYFRAVRFLDPLTSNNSIPMLTTHGAAKP